MIRCIWSHWKKWHVDFFITRERLNRWRFWISQTTLHWGRCKHICNYGCCLCTTTWHFLCNLSLETWSMLAYYHILLTCMIGSVGVISHMGEKELGERNFAFDPLTCFGQRIDLPYLGFGLSFVLSRRVCIDRAASFWATCFLWRFMSYSPL